LSFVSKCVVDKVGELSWLIPIYGLMVLLLDGVLLVHRKSTMIVRPAHDNGVVDSSASSLVVVVVVEMAPYYLIVVVVDITVVVDSLNNRSLLTIVDDDGSIFIFYG
jgi:hypothetical protein